MSNRTSFILAIFIFLFGTGYGIAVAKFKVFPYSALDAAWHLVTGTDASPQYTGPWAIGIYAGTDLYDLGPVDGLTNPVLTEEDVTDIDAVFVADPFLLKESDSYYMFFEILNRANNQGDIGLATSPDGLNWNYERVVLDEDFHLSYPYVFKWGGEHYMIPETHEDSSVRLYRASEFPLRWEHVSDLLVGHLFVDPTVVYFDNMWWMFSTTPRNDLMNLHYSEQLESGWTPHPMNPVIRNDANIARPGGGIIIHEGRPIRFAQDDDPEYGLQLRAFEITDLTTASYSEVLVDEDPKLAPSGDGWNAAGMHHISIVREANRYLAVVDGRDN
ncbi:hypothetical protein [Yoonia sp.]|uniref:glucosamine inositolphosphorylceramide transferase family protein n=1 Tax=Yoonia sp. TaxID=2212373 RepID=UPI00358E9822